MFKASKVFEKIKKLASGDASAKSDNPAKQADPQIARINSLLDIAEKARPNIPQNTASGRADSGETLRAEINLLKKDIRDIVGLIEARENAARGRESNGAPERKIAAGPDFQKRISGEISGMKSEIELLKKENAGIKKLAEDSKSAPREALPPGGLEPKISELAKKVSDLSREMNIERAMYPANIAKLETEIEKMKKSIASNNAEFGQKTKEILDSLQNEVAVIKAAKKDVPKKTENIESAVFGLRKEIGALGESVQKNTGSFESLLSRIRALESDKNSIAHKKDIESALSANATMEKKCALMEREMSELKARASSLENSLKAARKESMAKETAALRESAMETKNRLEAAGEGAEGALKRLEDIRKLLNN